MDQPDIRKAVGTARCPMETPEMRGRTSCRSDRPEVRSGPFE